MPCSRIIWALVFCGLSFCHACSCDQSRVGTFSPRAILKIGSLESSTASSCPVSFSDNPKSDLVNTRCFISVVRRDYEYDLFRRPLDILDSCWDQSAFPHLALFALVNAPKSTGHSAPGTSSLALVGNPNCTPACVMICATGTRNLVKSLPRLT